MVPRICVRETPFMYLLLVMEWFQELQVFMVIKTVEMVSIKRRAQLAEVWTHCIEVNLRMASTAKITSSTAMGLPTQFNKSMEIILTHVQTNLQLHPNMLTQSLTETWWVLLSEITLEFKQTSIHVISKIFNSQLSTTTPKIIFQLVTLDMLLAQQHLSMLQATWMQRQSFLSSRRRMQYLQTLSITIAVITMVRTLV